MSKQPKEFEARLAVNQFGKVLAFCAVIMLAAIYMVLPFDFAPASVKWWAFLANCITLFFSGTAYYGFFLDKRKKDLWGRVFYWLMLLVAAGTFVLSMSVYLP